MNLGARIIGVGTYVFFLLFFCFLIGKVGKKGVKKVLIAYAIILALIGFFFVPNAENDLYRVHGVINDFSKIPFDTFMTKSVPASNVPVALIYYWIIGQFSINGLISFITALIFYLNIFYVFSDYAKKNDITGKALSLSLLIIMCNSSFMEVIGGIRAMLSFSIILRCIYNEIFNNKSLLKDIIWYVVAALIHPVSLAVIIIRLVFATFQKSKTKIKKWFLTIFSIVSLIMLFCFGNQFITAMTDKANNYINNDSYSYIWGYIITFLILVGIFVLQKKCKGFENNTIDARLSLKNNRFFSYVIEMLMLVFVYEYSIFSRFGNFNLLLNIPVIIYYTNTLLKNNNKSYKYLLLYFLGILLLTCVRGDLCALKFWGGI